MRKRSLPIFLFLFFSLLGPTLAQLDLERPNESDHTIVVGSKLLPESRILAELMSQLLEAHTDFDVVRRLGLGGTMVCFQAMQNGEIDIYPEYTGTGAVTILELDLKLRDPLQTFLVVSRGFRKRFNITWLEPFGFNNTYVLAVHKDVASQFGLETISDLKEVEETVNVGVSHEFLNRADGFPGLQDVYDLNFANIRGMEHSLAYQAVDSRNIDVLDAFSTDGELMRYDLTLLEDDRLLFPPYHGAPLIRQEVLSAHPQIREVLTKLAWRLDDETMRGLNYRVQEEKISIAEVARDFLTEEGLLGEVSVSQEAEAGGFFSYLQQRAGKTLSLTVEHLTLVGLSLGLAILVGLPLGIFITRYQRFAQPVLSLSGIIQTIPSIALLAFFIAVPGLGLGLRSAVVALFLYALLPIVRNTYTGIQEVDPKLLEAARGIGLTERELLTIVELPLAVRTIMAGVRTSAVINIGVATLAAFIGAGGLGEPIVTGLQLNDPYLILSGAVPAALLAVVVDKALGLLEGGLTPGGS